jgi:eukaryotic-like serine/threonine-protein kinase
MINEGVRLGHRYELRRQLATGGMGEVWLANDERLDRLVAIKTLREGRGEHLHRFSVEVKVQAPLEHPSVVRLLDAHLDGEMPFLVMAYIQGRSLAALLEQGPLPPEHVRSLGAQVASGLAHAHVHGVVHRDLKPSNVLVNDEGNAYLTDFGIAQLDGSARVTGTGEVIGTAAYAAPEQVRGDTVTAAADVYSLGLVLLEALTGRFEYPGMPVEAAVARLHRAPRIPADLPEPWPGLLAAMTSDDPAQRPGAADVARELGASTGNFDRSAPSVPFGHPEVPARPPDSRHETSEMPVRGTGEAATGTSAATGISRGRSRRDSHRSLAAVAAAVAVVAFVAVAAWFALGQQAQAPAEPPVTVDEAIDRLEETIRP